LYVAKKDTKGGMSGIEAAQKICQAIDTRDLQPGEVAIYLDGWGYGREDDPNPDTWCYPPLIWHWDDELEDKDVPGYWRTLWMQNGINGPDHGARAWMADFISEYKRMQDEDSTLPDPSRFHFNLESGLEPRSDPDTVALFRAMMDDDRSGDSNDPEPGEGIRGWDDTLKRLYYQEFGQPYPACGPAEGSSCWDTENQEWTLWYARIACQAMDAAMGEAAYSQISDQSTGWPGCLSGNTRVSCRTDGQGDPPRVYTFRGNGVAATWYHPYWQGSADLQSPMLYQPHSDHYLPGEDCVDTTLRIARANLDACIQSFGGGHADEMAPWIPNIGWTYSDCDWSKDDARRMVAMLRAKGVGEMVIYENPEDPSDANDWSHWPSLIVQVWGTSLHEFEGDPNSPYLEQVEFSDEVYLSESASRKGRRYQTIAEAMFTTDFAGDGELEQLRVHIEAKVGDSDPSDINLAAALYDHQVRKYRDIGSVTLDPPGEKVIYHCDSKRDVSDFIEEETGNVSVRITCTAGDDFTSSIDLIQLVGSDSE
jgi:hypothetical protein